MTYYKHIFAFLSKTYKAMQSVMVKLSV